MTLPDYAARLQQQIEQYRHVENMHDLPDIFHYWSNKYLRPKINAVLEVDSIVEFYAEHLRRAALKHTGPYMFGSLGAGDCSVEIAIAKSLRSNGLADFVIECFELSPLLLARAADALKEAGLENCVHLVPIDLNAWSPVEKSYTGIIANHSLHHMVELEKIFASTRAALRPDGVFVTNDMIGRNGHMRWPETLKIVEQIWGFLPDRLKINRQLNLLDEKFVNRDCSSDGFEGIRAQDILPLLVNQFEFSHFLGYGGLIDLFVDRGYGHNFDPESSQDVALIDFIHELNEIVLEHGIIKPTIMFAVMTPGRAANSKFHRNLSPMFSVRTP